MLSHNSLTPSLVPQQVLDRIAAIALRIRESLDLDSILNAASREVRQLLQTDRVLIYRFQPDGRGLVVVESVGSEWTPILGKFISDPCFNAKSAESYRQGRVGIIQDIYTSDVKPCYLELLAQFQVRANLVVPILQGEHLWGLLIAHHCSGPRQWQQLEIDLLSTLAVQIAIAIQQAELYEQAHIELGERRRAEAIIFKLNEELEARVNERTSELRRVNEQLQAEIAERLQVQRALQESQLCLRLINTISTARTTGLSEEQIVERTLCHIHQFFSNLGVAYYTINEQGQLKILQALETPEIALSKGLVVELTAAPVYLDLLRQGEPAIVQDVAQEPFLAPLAHWLEACKTQALLAVPLRHGQKLMGLLSLHAAAPQRWSEYQIGSLMEIADYLSLTLQEAYQNQERQRAEQARWESESTLRSFFDSASMMMGIVELVEDDILHISDNPAAAKFFGLSPHGRQNLLSSETGMPREHLCRWIEVYREAERTRSPVRFEYPHHTALGQRWLSATSAAIAVSSGSRPRFAYVVEDITERKQAEEKLKASLREKEVLLKEIHHRVKNNLQIVSGLLYLQSRYVEDKQTLQVLQDNRDRIQSMALLHEKLYGSQNLDKIDFKDYVSTLTNNLFISCGVNTNFITSKLNIEPISLNIDTAIPCGLIVNELISNALKHAFPQGGKGEIAIEFCSIGKNSFELIVSDNGIGFTRELNFKNKKSLGLRLVHSLATKQLEGTLEADGSQGAKFKILFKT